MCGYVLVSCAGERGRTWRPLQPTAQHIALVEQQPRAAARAHAGLHPRISEAEMTVRREWHVIIQSDPQFNLATIIELVSRRHSIRPAVMI